MAKRHWYFKMPMNPTRDVTVSLAALGFLTRLILWCQDHGTNLVQGTGNLRAILGQFPGIKRARLRQYTGNLRKAGYLQGTIATGLRVICYTPDAQVAAPRSRQKKKNKEPPPPPANAGGERRAAESSADGGDEQRHEQRPESKALWKLVANWGPIPPEMWSLSAKASQGIVAYAIDIQPRRLNGTIKEPWQYLWTCVHPKKTKENPTGKRKPPRDAAMKAAAKRIDAERKPGPLGTAAANLAEWMGRKA